MLISVPIVISTLLIIYLIYSISELVFDFIKDAIPYIVMSIGSLIVYIIVSYLIYISDVYRGGIKLLIVASLFIFLTSLLPINELFYYERLFTILINISQILAFYIFRQFLLEMEMEKITSETKNAKKYL